MNIRVCAQTGRKSSSDKCLKAVDRLIIYYAEMRDGIDICYLDNRSNPGRDKNKQGGSLV